MDVPKRLFFHEQSQMERREKKERETNKWSNEQVNMLDAMAMEVGVVKNNSIAFQ